MAGFTQAQLDALEEAIAEGALSVRYRDRTIEYRSLEEMLRIRDKIKKELGQTRKTTRIQAEFSKGLK